MSSEAFVISAVTGVDAGETIRRALEDAAVKLPRVQDVLFDARGAAHFERLARDAGLKCPTVSVPSGLRAIFFAGQAILSGDVELNIVVGLEKASCAVLVLAGSEAVGRWNLMPRARLAARSMTGEEAALRSAGIVADEVTVSMQGDRVELVAEAVEELETRKALWALIYANPLALLIQRV
jgi:acetyl-CoA acetyltransferase